VSIRILLADDHKIMREGLRSLLEKQQGIEVIAETDNGRTAVSLCREYIPGLVDLQASLISGQYDCNSLELLSFVVVKRSLYY
jgi:DNA-binding NarL/FixJ family response regulator